jgi:hypothetical protein
MGDLVKITVQGNSISFEASRKMLGFEASRSCESSRLCSEANKTGDNPIEFPKEHPCCLRFKSLSDVINYTASI